VRLKSYRTFQLLVYAADVNLLEDNIDTISKNTGTLIDASKEVGLEVNLEKYVYVGVSGPECRPKSGYKNSKQIIWKYITISVFGKDSTTTPWPIVCKRTIPTERPLLVDET
jgi:hypothetical protein